MRLTHEARATCVGDPGLDVVFRNWRYPRVQSAKLAATTSQFTTFQNAAM